MTERVWTRAIAASAASALASALTGALTTGRLAAQEAVPLRDRYTVEGYAARYAVDDRLGTNTQSFAGFGLRVTLNPPDADRAARDLIDRATGSLFATYTTRQGTPDVSTLHVGVQTDFSILPRPLARHVDPFFGLGLGIFRTSRRDVVTGRGRVNRADLALSPGVGVRFPFRDGVGLRLDARAPLVFGTSTTANVVGEAGIYFSF